MAQPPLETMRSILNNCRTIAVVGLSPRPDRPSHAVAAYLQGHGYRIFPVNPTIANVLGERAYPTLRAIPEHVDVVQIFRRPEHVPAIVDDAIAVGAGAVWMQSGIVCEAAAARARAAGLAVVMNACMMTTHRALRVRRSDR